MHVPLRMTLGLVFDTSDSKQKEASSSGARHGTVKRPNMSDFALTLSAALVSKRADFNLQGLPTYCRTWLQHFCAHVVVFDTSKSWRAQDVLVARFLRSVMSGIHFGIRCIAGRNVAPMPINGNRISRLGFSFADSTLYVFQPHSAPSRLLCNK